MIIYKITNKINQKVYIGQTIRTLEERFLEHKRAKKDFHLHNAMRKYGEENFIAEIIDTATSRDELNEKEIYWINYYKSDIDGYNMKPGGSYNPMNVEKIKISHDEKMHSLEVRTKISETMKKHFAENPVSDDTRRKLSEYRKQRCFIKKGDIVKQVLKTELDKYLEDGWIKGGRSRDLKAIEATAKARYTPVYCIDIDGNKVAEFKSVKDAACWWYDNGYIVKDKYQLSNRIKQSYKQDIFIKGLKWFYKSKCVETIEKVGESRVTE